MKACRKKPAIIAAKPPRYWPLPSLRPVAPSLPVVFLRHAVTLNKRGGPMRSEHPRVISVGLNTVGLPRPFEKGSEYGFFVDLEQLWF